VVYDLVIIGATPAGIEAALLAVHLKKRVALVQQLSLDNLEASEDIFSKGYSDIIHLYKLINQWQETAIYPQWQQLREWLEEVDKTINARHSLARLATEGIDVIPDSGEFVRLPRLGFVVNGRQLLAKHYIIATGFYPQVPRILGLDEVNYFTVKTLWQESNLDNLGQHLGIIGDSAIAISLAQILRRLGKEISLISGDNYLLPDTDRKISHLVTAILEAEGIKIYPRNSVSQVKAIEGQKWLQLGNHVIEVDDLIFAGNYQVHWQGLNLEAVGVKIDKGIISVNQRLQTDNSRIYSLNFLRNNYPDPTLHTRAAGELVKHLLLGKKFNFNFDQIPSMIAFDPTIAWVGLTGETAKRKYGEEVKIINYPIKNIVASQLWGETTGFCQLIARKDGKILGAQIVGNQAAAVISLLGLALQENLPLQSLNKNIYPWGTMGEIIGEMTELIPPRKSWLTWLKNYLTKLISRTK
jgi:pyruvate/2-oxoglutarate dehydrogenase complex dihydrolipoamide dehydrogenase (E3) component